MSLTYFLFYKILSLIKTI